MRVRFLHTLAPVMMSLCICGSCLAQSLGTAFSDLWWNPAESGWGVTVDHQQDVMFLTSFIYRRDGSPYWVTSVLSHPVDPSRPFFFSGDVYETHGHQPDAPALLDCLRAPARRAGYFNLSAFIPINMLCRPGVFVSPRTLRPTSPLHHSV